MHRRLLLPAALLVAAGTTAALTGCSGISDVLHHQVQGTYDSPAALLQAWRTPATPPDWIPAGAKDLRVVAATNGRGADDTPAVVRVTTTSALPKGCTAVQRRSMDPFSVSWAPDAVPDTVQRCGNWAIVPVSGGYYGWTPLSAEERAE